MNERKSKASWLWFGSVAVIALVLGAFFLRAPLGRWMGFAPEAQPEPASAAKPEALPELHSSLEGELVATLRDALDLVDNLGQELVRDALEPAQTIASELEGRLTAIGASGAPSDVVEALNLARQAAAAIAGASSLDDARMQLGELNRPLFHLGAHAEQLREGYHVFRCPMAPGFPLWLQESDSIANPYMGTSMPLCGVKTDWPTEVGEPSAADTGPSATSDEIAYWTCSMHPSVRGEEHDTCPICAMNLTPVTVLERDEGLLFIDEHRRQLINMRTTEVQRMPLVVPVRGYAEVTVAEPLRKAVNLRVEGWIQRLHANEPGQAIKAGEPLFTLYSPELYSAQDEFLTARAGRSEALMLRSKERLQLFSLSEEQIEDLAQRGTAEPTVEILAPQSGYLLRKSVIEGDRVAAGVTVMEIARLDPVWLELEVFEGDVPLVQAGGEVSLKLSNIPGRSFTGTIDYVYPTLDARRRAARARIVVENPDLALRPGMHVSAELEIHQGERLLVPKEAVVYTGPRRLVFVDIGEGRLVPREIETGHATASHLEVLSGLNEGDRVVSSGTFLVASESRIRSAETVWGADNDDN